LDGIASREMKIRALFDTSGRGLEIGPSYNAIVPKSGGFRVEIVDHASTEDLRAKYSNEPNIDASRIEEVDYVWDGRPLSVVIGARRGGRPICVKLHGSVLHAMSWGELAGVFRASGHCRLSCGSALARRLEVASVRDDVGVHQW
jgi:hypothetical protein